MGKGCAAPSRCNSTFAAFGIARLKTTLPSGCTCGFFGGAGASGTGASGLAAGCALAARGHIPRQNAVTNARHEKVNREARGMDRDIRGSSRCLGYWRSIVYIPGSNRHPERSVPIRLRMGWWSRRISRSLSPHRFHNLPRRFHLLSLVSPHLIPHAIRVVWESVRSCVGVPRSWVHRCAGSLASTGRRSPPCHISGPPHWTACR